MALKDFQDEFEEISREFKSKFKKNIDENLIRKILSLRSQSIVKGIGRKEKKIRLQGFLTFQITDEKMDVKNKIDKMVEDGLTWEEASEQIDILNKSFRNQGYHQDTTPIRVKLNFKK